MDFEKALENIKTIKLTGGIFGKTSLVLIVLTICAAAVSLKVDVWWVPLALMLPLIGITFYILKRCLDFAEKNPHAAIMDGAELLVHERIIHGRKGQDMLPDLPLTVDHEPPPLPLQDLNLPDQLPLAAPESTNNKGAN
jgi:hypothetical protein